MLEIPDTPPDRAQLIDCLWQTGYRIMDIRFLTGVEPIWDYAEWLAQNNVGDVWSFGIWPSDRI